MLAAGGRVAVGGGRVIAGGRAAVDCVTKWSGFDGFSAANLTIQAKTF